MHVLFNIPTRPSPTFSKPFLWSPEIKDFVSKCLIKDPENRPTASRLLEVNYIKNKFWREKIF